MVVEKEPTYIFSNDLLMALEKALNIPVAKRIVIDVNYGHFVTVYVEMPGDERLLQIDWAGHLKGTEVKIVRTSESNDR